MQEISQKDAPWLGRMMALVPELARNNGCRPGPQGGFRLLTNTGIDGGQEIAHLHFNLIGGPRPWKSSAAPAASWRNIMGSFSCWHWPIFLVIMALIFGSNKFNICG